MIKHKITEKGFTLTEMLVVMGIVTVLMAVVVFNYQSVNHKSILKNVAYDVALSIREIQSLGLGAKKYVNTDSTSSFTTPFGAQFNQGDNSYMIFADEFDNDVVENFCGTDDVTSSICDCTSSVGECISEVSSSYKGIALYDACMIDGSTTNCINTGTGQASFISVVFKRPNPDAKLYNGTTYGDTINIIFRSKDDNGAQAISITKTGQVSVIPCDLTDGIYDGSCGL